MIDYTKTPEVNQILQRAEDLLTEIIGRYNAQRYIAIFTELQTHPSQEPLNLWQAIYDAGKKASGKP
jgi:hypothetical protein